MDTVRSILHGIRCAAVPGGGATVACVIIALVFGLYQIIARDDQVPSIPERIPFLSNTYRFLKNKPELIQLARNTFGDAGIVKYNLLFRTVYLVCGPRNIQVLNRASPDLGSEGFFVMVMRNSWDIQPKDLVKFKNDKTGRLKAPVAGTEATPDSQRYWRAMHELYHEYLSTSHYANALATKFYSFFDQRLSRAPLSEWETVGIWDFLKVNMFEAAMTTLDGPKILDLNPDFSERYWEYDQYALIVSYGAPKFLNRKAYQAKDEFYVRTARYLEAAWKNFDWSGPDVESDWEVNFGSRFTRELAKWARDNDFDKKSLAGLVGVLAFGLNSNTIPAAAWMLIHLVQDPSLFKAVQEEAMEALITDGATGTRSINRAKLVTLPLLQSVYIEVLRLHVSFSIMREVNNSIDMNGHRIPKGSFLQGMTDLGHFEDEVWSTEGHPASEFWASRHLVYKEITTETGERKRVAEVSMEGKNGSFFPYGGGTGICPGRHFAKQEILLAVASIVTRFDVEFIEWVHMDGTKSSRAAMDDPKNTGTGVTPPDRDMKVRWRRMW
ncbi:Cytochrome P450 [Naviculisporaceae sp. PSN 640]